jgi:hypothetical protein
VGYLTNAWPHFETHANVTEVINELLTILVIYCIVLLDDTVSAENQTTIGVVACVLFAVIFGSNIAIAFFLTIKLSIQKCKDKRARAKITPALKKMPTSETERHLKDRSTLELESRGEGASRV